MNNQKYLDGLMSAKIMKANNLSLMQRENERNDSLIDYFVVCSNKGDEIGESIKVIDEKLSMLGLGKKERVSLRDTLDDKESELIKLAIGDYFFTDLIELKPFLKGLLASNNE